MGGEPTEQGQCRPQGRFKVLAQCLMVAPAEERRRGVGLTGGVGDEAVGDGAHGASKGVAPRCGSCDRRPRVLPLPGPLTLHCAHLPEKSTQPHPTTNAPTLSALRQLKAAGLRPLRGIRLSEGAAWSTNIGRFPSRSLQRRDLYVQCCSDRKGGRTLARHCTLC